jgi:hypothetical protein
MLLNVIHRVDPGEDKLETLDFQLRSAWERNLKTTVLVSYSALADRQASATIEALAARPEVELGIHTHGMACPAFTEQFKTREPAFYLLGKERKRAFIHDICTRFKALTGRDVVVFGGYLLDAWTLNFLAANYARVEAAITNCFEEGVKMFHGNNNNWMLLCDGGPWFPYFPSKDNALCPASGVGDWNGIVGFPHLNRDMSLSLSSRDDLYSSHPVNLFRAMINDGADCPYNRAFIDAWVRQCEGNGYSYYSLFVSCPWLTQGHWAVPDVTDARKLYLETLDRLAELREEGRVESQTMVESARYVKEHRGFEEPTTCLWNNLLGKSRKQLYWHVTSQFRMALDWHAGGTIVDLRAYGGRLNRDLGPDGPGRWNGNYPFLISTELRGGHGVNGAFGQFEIEGETVSLMTGRTEARVKRTGKRVEVTGEPVLFETKSGKVVVQSRFIFEQPDEWIVERILLEAPEGKDVLMSEAFIGTFGLTDYPEDMSPVVLRMARANGSVVDRHYCHEGMQVEQPDCSFVEADVPMAGVRIRLSPVGGATRGVIRDGTLFHPVYGLELKKPLRKGETLVTCAQLENL